MDNAATGLGTSLEGARFGEYRIGTPLGAGGFATVYRLHDPESGDPTQWCLKVGHDRLPGHYHDPLPALAGPFPAQCVGVGSEYVHLWPPGPDEIRNVLMAAPLAARPHAPALPACRRSGRRARPARLHGAVPPRPDPARSSPPTRRGTRR